MTRYLREGSGSRSAIGLALHIGAALRIAAALVLRPGLHEPLQRLRRPRHPRRRPRQTTAASRDQLMQSFALNKYKRELDGQWQGIRLASDGNVYFASSSHSAHHGASFFKYDTATGQITELVHEITDICGEDVQTNPQGKIHSDIVEANGWLYMATHFSAEKPGAYKTWTGAHALGYELATGRWRDYGVILPGTRRTRRSAWIPCATTSTFSSPGRPRARPPTCIASIPSPETRPTSGRSAPRAMVGYDFSSYWTFVDQRGDVWFSIKNQGGDLQQIHGDTGVIEVHPNALPAAGIAGTPTSRTDPDSGRAATSNGCSRSTATAPCSRCLPNGGMLYMFDSTKPMASAFQHIRTSASPASASLSTEIACSITSEPIAPSGMQDAGDFHLLSVSLDEAAGYPITDHGLMVDQDGRKVWRMPGMATDGQGHVYTIGDWWTIPGDLGTLRYDWKRGNEIYEQLPRGQFFAVANVTIPASSPTGHSAP